MKKLFTLALASVLMLSTLTTKAEEKNIKTGLNFGPLPAIAFDADKGFQYGALLNIYNFGDGSSYPNYKSYWYFEASFFTKGSKLFQVQYDNMNIFPGVRLSAAVEVNLDGAMDFYGYNGYQSLYDRSLIDQGNYSAKYKFKRNNVTAKADFVGNITEHLKWEAGYHFDYFDIGAINRAKVNKGKKEGKLFPDDEPTIYEEYVKWGLISEDQAKGGYVSSIRLGLVYDSRDKEGAPTRGIWADAHVTAAPKWLGSSHDFYRYNFTWRQYFPLLNRDRLTLAYRLNYTGTFGSDIPFYSMPYMNVMGKDKDRDGMGSYNTVRGIMRDRIVGLDMALYNVELRFRFPSFIIAKQNIAFGLSAFSDGAMVTRGYGMSYKGRPDDLEALASYKLYMDKAPKTKDVPHITAGAGVRFIMNENFIVCAEYGMPISHLRKNSPTYNQDGNGAFYINLGYLF